MKKEIDDLMNVVDIQGYNGNWNFSEYMWGMYNGMELALAIVENREPKYKEKPKKFLCEPDEPPRIEKIRKKALEQNPPHPLTRKKLT
jgi:hypothetical protein